MEILLIISSIYIFFILFSLGLAVNFDDYNNEIYGKLISIISVILIFTNAFAMFEIEFLVFILIVILFIMLICIGIAFIKDEDCDLNTLGITIVMITICFALIEVSCIRIRVIF